MQMNRLVLVLLLCLLLGIHGNRHKIPRQDNRPATTMDKKSKLRKQTVLVVGATGATGRLVVKILLNKGHTVRAVVRSKEKRMNLLPPTTKRLHLTQASLLELDSSRLEELVAGCDAIISCLGHNMTRQGIWGKTKRLVAQSVQRLAVAATIKERSTKLVLMGSIGVANPNGKDDPRGLGERLVLTLFRWWVPPHATMNKPLCTCTRTIT